MCFDEVSRFLLVTPYLHICVDAFSRVLRQLSVDIVWRQLFYDVVCYAIIIRH